MKEIRENGKLKKVIFDKRETKDILKPNIEALNKRDAYFRMIKETLNVKKEGEKTILFL